VGDLLIRNLDDALKRELQERARANGRSLSDEAIMRLRKSLGTADQQNRLAGEWLRSLLSEDAWSDDELADIEAARREPDREPPAFGK
jgi:plasmid stability protein